jgi:biopolymer transport protein ExbB/TolQ
MLWLTVVGWLARLIFVFLVGLSIWSIAIILERRKFYQTIKLPDADLKKSIRSKKSSLNADEQTFLKDFLIEAARLNSNEQIERAFDVFISEKKSEMEKGLSILGTLGSTTPFIGLLGTVLGIIVSFGELSQGSGSTNSVMFSLAEALVLTAMGLLVAIPAVIAFNFFSRKARLALSEAVIIKNILLNQRA